MVIVVMLLLLLLLREMMMMCMVIMMPVDLSVNMLIIRFAYTFLFVVLIKFDVMFNVIGVSR